MVSRNFFSVYKKHARAGLNILTRFKSYERDKGFGLKSAVEKKIACMHDTRFVEH